MPTLLRKSSNEDKASEHGSVFRGFISANVELAAIIMAAVILAVLPSDMVNSGPILCPIRRFTGNLCPTCGITRSVHSIIHGDFAQGWILNPAGFIFVVAVLSRGIALRLNSSAWAKVNNHVLFEIVLLVSFFGLAFLRYFQVI